MKDETIQRLKAAICRQISGIENNGFAYLGPVLREALFGDGSIIDWTAVAFRWNRHNPNDQISE